MARPRRIAVQMELHWPLKRHTAIYAGLQQYAEEQGWETILDDFVSDHLARGGQKTFSYDGVIGRIDRDLAARAALMRLPVVNVWYSSPARELLPGAFTDQVATGRLVAEHLLDRGLRRFAVTHRTDRSEQLAAQAFRDAIRGAGCECTTVELPLEFTHSATHYRPAMQMIQEAIVSWHAPLGVFVANDALARIIAQTCRRLGLRTPHDAAIVCGENEEVFCLHTKPALTSVEWAYLQIGRAAAALLDDMMQNGTAATTPPPQVFVPPAGLVVRESTDFVAVNDPLVNDALAFISANMQRDIGQGDVARAVHCEVRTLQLRFRKVLGKPIVATIRHLRLERAQRELAHSDRTLEAIARDTGFGSSPRLAAVFRRELGTTPSSYRRRWSNRAHA